MSKFLKLVFIVIFLASVYHLIRDTLQVFGLHSSFTNILHRPHLWCKPYCNYVTYPLDLLGIVGSLVVLKRDRLGLLGALVVFSLPLWFLATILP